MVEYYISGKTQKIQEELLELQKKVPRIQLNGILDNHFYQS
ncbi:hypothetical protein [Listeria seeligeri]|nr:hypothetical protein [Listeria seeligeri]